MLERALSLGREDLAEQGLEENEIEVELAAVETERAWLQSLRGRGEEAMAAYSQVLLRGGKNDATVQAVAANNLACLKGTLHVAESLKRLEKVVPLGKAAPVGRKGAPAAKEERDEAQGSTASASWGAWWRLACSRSGGSSSWGCS